MEVYFCEEMSDDVDGLRFYVGSHHFDVFDHYSHQKLNHDQFQEDQDLDARYRFLTIDARH